MKEGECVAETHIRQNRYRQVREDLGWSRAQMAEKLGVDNTTVGNWETGKRQMTLEKLVFMSEVTGFTVQHLLGFDNVQVDWTKPLSKEALAIMHRAPVWTASHGWGLVNNANRTLVFADLKTLDIDAVQEPLYGFPPVLAYSLYGTGEPLTRVQVEYRNTVWVEPITLDAQLSVELRGWYHLYEKRLVQSEFGHRFYLDTYGVKWLAFDDCFGAEDNPEACSRSDL